MKKEEEEKKSTHTAHIAQKERKSERANVWKDKNSKLMRRSTCLVGLVYLANMKEAKKKPYILTMATEQFFFFVRFMWRLLCALIAIRMIVRWVQI